jgi:hypothetical protein
MILAFIFSAVVFAARMLAATDPSWTTYLLNGGPFAVVVLLIILDKLNTPGERDRLRVENELLKKQVAELNESIRKDIVPALTQVNTLNAQTIEVLKDFTR